jgi:hypothetical protein
VRSLSNLIVSGQVCGGDLIRVDLNSKMSSLIFFKDDENIPTHVMIQMVDASILPPPMVATAESSAVLRSTNAKSSRR